MSPITLIYSYSVEKSVLRVQERDPSLGISVQHHFYQKLTRHHQMSRITECAWNTEYDFMDAKLTSSGGISFAEYCCKHGWDYSVSETNDNCKSRVVNVVKDLDDVQWEWHNNEKRAIDSYYRPKRVGAGAHVLLLFCE